MPTFTVNDMTCGHCTATIGKAVKALDTDARVDFDLPAHVVRIDSGRASAEQLRRAIADAGYTPVPVVESAS